MTNWHASIEWTATDHPAHEDVADSLLTDLEDQHVGAVSFPDELNRWGTTFSVSAPTIQEATTTAIHLLTAAAENAGMTEVKILGVDITDDAGHAARNNTPAWPA